MSANLESKVFITANTNGYIYDLNTSTLTLVTLPPTGGVNDFIDSYFVFTEEGTGFFYIYDGAVFDILDAGVTEGMADHLVAPLCDHSELWLFCQRHTEVWQDTGDEDFPFQRMPGGLIPQGCAAKFTPKRLDNSIFWLGRNEDGQGVVWRANGYTPTRVSTYAIETAIQGYGDISDAIALTYQQEGHSFYALTFPSAGATWVLDVSNGLWHERASLDVDTGQLGRWRPNCLTFFQGALVAGDYRTGKLFSLSLDNYTDGNYGPVTGFTPEMYTTDDGANSKLAGVRTSATATGYIRTEVLTLAGGTFVRPAKVMVVNNTSGGVAVVSTLAIVDCGDYTITPSNPIATVGGSGTGLTLNGFWTTDDAIEIAPESGAGYSPNAPTLSIATIYGAGASATASSQLVAARASAGAGYALDDVLTLSGGTYTTPAQVRIVELGGGDSPATFAIVDPGVYSIAPLGFVTLTGGSGAGANCTTVWGLGEITLTDGGSEYSQTPTVTVFGSGVGATVTAVVDSTTNWIKSIRSWRALPQGQNNLKRTFHHALQLDGQSGVGLDGTGQGSDPQVILQWSDDGGHTWSNEHARSMGRIGETGYRVIWRRLGSTEKLRDRVYQIYVTDPVKRCFTGAELDLSPGAS